jgi:hypothetical protein
MKYTGKIKLHTQSPFYSNLLEELERKVFEQPTSVMHWYWHSQNSHPLQVIYEKDTHTLTQESLDRYMGLWLSGADWADCDVHSYSHKRGIPGELEFKGAAKLVSLKNATVDPNLVQDFWVKNYCRGFEISMGEKTTQCLVSDTSHTSPVETYNCNTALELVKVVRRMFAQANLAVFRTK